MSNTPPANSLRVATAALTAACGLFASLCQTAGAVTPTNQERPSMTSEQALSKEQQAIVPTAAFAAIGDMTKLNAALNQGLDAGLTVSDEKEILVQLYAYAGFPRSLNALGELMKVLAARKQRGIEDAAGRGPSQPIPAGEKLLAVGTANQTKLSGRPVKGPLFEFARPLTSS